MSKELGTRISELLQKQGVSQKELAKRIGVTEAAMSRYISGTREPKPDVIAKPDGTFHEMRFYNEHHYLIMEITYHPEPNLNNGNRTENILHVHEYPQQDNFRVRPAHRITKQEYEKYKNSLRGCLKLKNGDVREFVDHIHYGDELWFLYKGKKYFLEGWANNGSLDLCLYEMADNGEKHIWKGNTTHYPVEAFLEAKIWNGKSFWDAEQDMEWVDD